MNYEETLDFLFNRLQSFHNQGATAYKPGLEKAYRLSEAFGNPHLKFAAVHVGGTNGKGSTAHSVASVLMSAGLRVGLYTSPHLVDFTERIRIDGKPIEKEFVVDFVERFRAMQLTDTDPSFFELTTIMAFDWFAKQHVDVAVVEVGLGGRLDTTNIVKPVLSVVTNISLDHTALLGSTLAEIAAEKAGIIKPGVPAVIGRRNPLTDPVFTAASPLVTFAQDKPMFNRCNLATDTMVYEGTPWGKLECDLTGDCQPENMQTVLTALSILQEIGFVHLDNKSVSDGLSHVCSRTGLMGRWTQLKTDPITVVDTAHNVDGWTSIVPRLRRHLPRPLHIVVGFVSDKDYCTILSMLPPEATYYFVQPSVARAASAEAVQTEALKFGLNGQVYPSVKAGYDEAVRQCGDATDAMIYVGGSTFVVADLLNSLI